jgi:SAM-dependent methyltransferase
LRELSHFEKTEKHYDSVAYAYEALHSTPPRETDEEIRNFFRGDCDSLLNVGCGPAPLFREPELDETCFDMSQRMLDQIAIRMRYRARDKVFSKIAQDIPERLKRISHIIKNRKEVAKKIDEQLKNDMQHLTLRKGNIAEQDFGNKVFDGVLASGVLQDMKTPEEAEKVVEKLLEASRKKAVFVLPKEEFFVFHRPVVLSSPKQFKFERGDVTRMLETIRKHGFEPELSTSEGVIGKGDLENHSGNAIYWVIKAKRREGQ